MTAGQYPGHLRSYDPPTKGHSLQMPSLYDRLGDTDRGVEQIFVALPDLKRASDLEVCAPLFAD